MTMNDKDRADFEAWISGPPYERDIERYPNDPTRYAFPGTYCDIDVDLAWLAWLAARRNTVPADEVRELCVTVGLINTDEGHALSCMIGAEHAKRVAAALADKIGGGDE